MADPPRRAADHGAVPDVLAGLTPDGGTPDGGGTLDGGGIAGGPSDGGTPDAGTTSTASTPAQRQDCLEQADQWKYECETRGDMVCKVANYVAFGSGNFPVGVGLDVFCPSAYKAACRFDWKRDTRLEDITEQEVERWARRLGATGRSRTRPSARSSSSSTA